MIAEVMKMREEENKRSSQKSFFKKRWVFPAIYIASAAIILTAVLWYQSASKPSDKFGYNSSNQAGQKSDNQAAVEVNQTLENFQMPVKNADSAVIEKKFYDFNASTKDQEAALVFYNNTYQPNTGIDLTMKDGETFDVVAALSGTVTKVNEDSVLGNVIEIEHDKGVVTQYQSVKDINVKVGDQVKQGQVIAKAGQSLFNEKAGTHVHFEIRKDGVAVNPSDYFNKPLSALQDTNQKVQENKAKNIMNDGSGTPSDNSTDSTDNTNS